MFLLHLQPQEVLLPLPLQDQEDGDLLLEDQDHQLLHLDLAPLRQHQIKLDLMHRHRLLLRLLDQLPQLQIRQEDLLLQLQIRLEEELLELHLPELQVEVLEQLLVQLLEQRHEPHQELLLLQGQLVNL